MQLNDLLKAARKSKGLTQQQLADKLGRSRENILAVEKGTALTAITCETMVGWYQETLSMPGSDESDRLYNCLHFMLVYGYDKGGK